MNEATARQVVWLAAIQEVDGARDALPARLPNGESPVAAWRECFAAAGERQPRLLALDGRSRVPRWLGLAPIVLAFLTGLLAETLPTGGRLNLIAVPVLTLLLWNVGVYLWLFAGRSPHADPHGAGGFRAWLSDRCEAWLGGSRDAGGDPWQRVHRSFLHRWFNHSRPLLHLRIQFLLHLAATAAMLGLILGMYWRGLGFEYRAGWSSTFLDGASLRSLLGIVLGPAAWLSGIGLPDAAALDQLAWSRNPAGENAARWIHLYAVTAVLYVGIPRLLLAQAAARRIEQLRAAFPIDPAALGFSPSATAVRPGPENPRVRRICVLPFNLEMAAKERELLRLFASGETAGPVQLDIREKIDYADIDGVLERFEPADPAHAHAVVFNLTTTPEAEVQGQLLAGLRDRVERLLVYLDGGAFTERFGTAPDFAERLATRRALWTRFVEQYGLKPVFLRAEP
jgi:hypothetical protein